MLVGLSQLVHTQPEREHCLSEIAHVHWVVRPQVQEVESAGQWLRCNSSDVCNARKPAFYAVSHSKSSKSLIC